MKRLLALFTALLMVIAVSGCTDETKSAAEELPPVQAYEPVRLEGDIEGEITLYCFETAFYQGFLEAAAAAFEAQYPGTKVNITFLSAMPEVKTMELDDGTFISVSSNDVDENAVSDYLTRVNTEMMGGGGPDILAMDVIPYYRLAEMGLLEDLNGYIEEDDLFSRNNYMDNVLRGSEYKGGLYLMPTSVRFDVLAYDSERINGEMLNKLTANERFTYEELAAMAMTDFNVAENADGSYDKVFDFYGAYNAFTQMFNLDYAKYVDLENKTANFTDGAFEALLTFVKSLEEEGYIRADENINLDEVDFNELLTGEQQVYHYYLKTFADMMLSSLYTTDENGIVISFGGYAGNDENDVPAGMLQNNKGEIPFRYQQAYGINTNSQNKKTAWEFIKFLLSDEMQLSPNIYGTTINKNISRQRAELDFTGAIYLGDDAEKLDTPEKQGAFEAYYGDLMKYSSMLNRLTISDFLIEEMVNKEIEAFFAGEKSAAEAAAAIQNKVELYLNE